MVLTFEDAGTLIWMSGSVDGHMNAFVQPFFTNIDMSGTEGCGGLSVIKDSSSLYLIL